MTMTLTPAYGRDYTSKKAVQAALDSDKDFIVADFGNPWEGKPVNKSQLMADGIKSVNIRYKGLRSVGVFKLVATPEKAEPTHNAAFEILRGG